MRSTLQSGTAGGHVIYAIALLTRRQIPQTPPGLLQTGVSQRVDRVDAVERIGTLLAVPSAEVESIEAANSVG